MVPGHQRRSIRIPGYDYTQPGAYFITCVTWQRLHLFGEIANGNLKLSKLGDLAKKEWDHLAKRFPWIELDELVVMPNHIHGIIVIHDVGARGSSYWVALGNAPRALLQMFFTAKAQFFSPQRHKAHEVSLSFLILFYVFA